MCSQNACNIKEMDFYKEYTKSDILFHKSDIITVTYCFKLK